MTEPVGERSLSGPDSGHRCARVTLGHDEKNDVGVLCLRPERGELMLVGEGVEGAHVRGIAVPSGAL